MLKRSKGSKSANPGKGKILVGTSGWHYKHWLATFYPERVSPREMLSFYSREFPTVEVNNSFYRLPEQATFHHWKEQVPADFIFAVKASRYITHIKRLRDPKTSIDLLLERAAPLAEALGPVLFQLPPRWKLDLERLSDFLDVLPKSLQAVVEFRDRTWYGEHIYSAFRRRGVGLCIHDWGGEEWPQELTADFAYIRFHGAGQRYGGDYPDEVLKHWARTITSWTSRLKRTYVYFNNDAQGYALRNARTLRQMLGLDGALREAPAA